MAKAQTGNVSSVVTNNDLGTIVGYGDTRRVEVKRSVPYPIHDVWAALVDPEAVSQWFAEASIEPREGGKIELTFGKIVVTGSIKTFVPPYVLSYTWDQEGETTSLVQFDLIEIGDDETLITVVQTALDSPVACDVATGWHSMLDRLVQFLDTGNYAPQDKARWQELYAAYQVNAG